MEIREKEVLVVRITYSSSTKEPAYVTSVSAYATRTTTDPTEARDLSDHIIEEQITFLIDCQNRFSPDRDVKSIDLVKTKVQITDAMVNLSDPEMKEILQKIALNKLSKAEVAALNALDVLMYHKLKFHKEVSGNDDELDMPF